VADAGRPCVVDTDVLHHSNRDFPADDRRLRLKLARRIELLRQIAAGHRVLLVSRTLLGQYSHHLQRPFNLYLQEFLSVATQPTPNVRFNWAMLTGAQRDRAHRACRFPGEDILLLRTAYGVRSVIFSEETRVVAADSCIHRYFRVHIQDPTAPDPSA
jgi:hypothetical protein